MTPGLQRSDRRHVLAACLSGSALAYFASSGLANAQSTPAAVSPEMRLVNDFCASVATRNPAAVRAFFADDIVYRMDEKTPPFIGIDVVMATFQKFVGDATSVDFKIVETFASGPIVINRRIDRFALKQPLTVEVVGVFFVKDGKIKEWSDYTISLQRG